MIRKNIEDMKLHLNVLYSGKVVKKDIELQTLLFYTPYKEDNIKGEFVFINGYPYIKWEDSENIFDIIVSYKDNKFRDTFSKIILHWNTAKTLTNFSEELLDIQTYDNEECTKALIKLMKSIQKLKKIDKNQKNNILSPSEILDLMKANTEYPDLTGRVEGNVIYFYLEDPGEWEQSEMSPYQEEVVLTYQSEKKIKNFFENLSSQIYNVEIGIDYHLADVFCRLSIKDY